MNSFINGINATFNKQMQDIKDNPPMLIGQSVLVLNQFLKQYENIT